MAAEPEGTPLVDLLPFLRACTRCVTLADDLCDLLPEWHEKERRQLRKRAQKVLDALQDLAAELYDLPDEEPADGPSGGA
jgi:hypothetical protein